MAYITCKNAAFAYEGRTVVDGLNFVVEKDDYLCIVGENGSGKTTLMKGLLGLIKPVSGEITTGDGLLATEIGYLPQQTIAQKDFPASVYEVVLSGRLNSRGIIPFYGKADRKIAFENMEKLGILPLRKNSFRELSGGQQQRVLLARALCATDKLLLLDEPVSGLDPLVTTELYKTIQSLNRSSNQSSDQSSDQSSNITIIMISHDIKSAIEYASHILHLQNKQAFFGPTAEYLETEIGKKFLGRGQDDV